MAYPLSIGLSSSINKSPSSIVIEGKKHVAFRCSQNKVRLLDASCPHRGADLSLGKIKDDCLQCPYHHWEFDTSGNITNIPSLPGKKSFPKFGSVKSLDIVENGGFAWIVGDQNDNVPSEYCPELFDDGWEKIYGSRDVEGRAEDWIMNSVDISHINYVHDFADEDDGNITDMKVKKHSGYVECTANVHSKASSIFTQHMQPLHSEITSRFVYPSTTIIGINLLDPYEFVTFTTVTPIDENHSKLMFCFMYPKLPLLRLPFVKNKFKDEMYKTVAEDEAILGKVIPTKDMYLCNVPCDKYQIEVLNMLNL